MIRTTIIKPLQYSSSCPRTSGCYCDRTVKKGHAGTSTLKYRWDAWPSICMPVGGIIDLIRFTYDPLPVNAISVVPDSVGYIGMKQKQVMFDHIN